MERIGEVQETVNGFEWKISDFFQLSEDERYFSPSFTCNNTSWSLGIDPNGDKGNHSVGYIDLRLVKKPGDYPVCVEFSLALKTVNGEKDLLRHAVEHFGEGCDRHTSHRMISRDELIKRESELVPCGVLTVVCSLKTRINAESASDVEGTACAYCKDSFETEIISSHEKICVDKPMNCPDCSKAILIKNQYGHGCQIPKEEGKCVCCKENLGSEFISLHTKCLHRSIKCSGCSDDVPSQDVFCIHKSQSERTKAIEKLLIDLKRIMLTGDHSDVTIKLKEQEFKLHKSVLGARNPVFHSKLKNETQTITQDIINIDDCKPRDFQSFIHYIYTGTIDHLCPENVCDLYEVALVYQEEEMKSECIQFMLNTINIDNFCDYTTLALRYDEKELFQRASELFMSNAKEIKNNKNWGFFMEKYPDQTNELCSKVLHECQ